MNPIAWIVTGGAILLVPLLSFFYIAFRLPARDDQLKNLFTLPGILEAYLISKGLNVKKNENETDEDHLKRLKKHFETIFNTELSREYGRLGYVLATVVGSVSSGLVIYCLATGPLIRSLLAPSPTPPSPVDFALIGAFAWTVWLICTGYDTLDLVPSTFYWIPFRYITALIFGLVGLHVFKGGEVGMVFALGATPLPYPKILNFLRMRFLKHDEPPDRGGPSLWKIQGMHESTVSRLSGLGIETTQELAYYDPLTLLFRTNFPTKVVIDWIDQSLLYNYVTDKADALRARGIRGAIEMSGARDSAALSDVAKVLNTTADDVVYLTDKLGNDYQVRLVSKIWDEFRSQ